MFTLAAFPLIFHSLPLFPFVVAKIHRPFFDLNFGCILLCSFNEILLKKKKKNPAISFKIK